MISYASIKAVHVTAVVVSFCLFVLRGIWRMQDSDRLGARWVRIGPHVVDTILLASAIWLAILVENYPGAHAWLTAKVIGLVVYIVLGSIAIRRAKSPGVRIAAFAGAIAVFGYIVSVALTKSPMGFLAWV